MVQTGDMKRPQFPKIRDRKWMKTMRDKGMTNKQIAEMQGCSIRLVGRHMTKLGLTLSNGGRLKLMYKNGTLISPAEDKEYPRKWTDTRIEKELKEITQQFGRMCSANELRVLGKGRLAGAVAKHGGYRHWAKKLDLNMKGSETERGFQAEQDTKEYLEHQNYRVESTSSKCPFDLLVEGVKVDVKVAKHSTYFHKQGQIMSGYVFAGLKRGRTCNLFILCCLDQNEQVESRFFIPATKAPVTCITITKSGKYEQYRNDIDILKQMTLAIPWDGISWAEKRRTKINTRNGNLVRKWAQRNPEKKRAIVAVNNAIRDERLFRQPCEVCGLNEVQAHHFDYNKPLEVNWLCIEHHAAVHHDS